MEPMELWGGVECTLNRVQDVFYDQLIWSGHYDRISDLDLFADLKIRAIRYPALWERWHNEPDWSWLDRRLERLRELGIRPILGLVHHGSGPKGTSLLDPNFASGLARFAERVATRYPWVTDYTPVNEPLTTARFCALYGHWYPHAASTPEFLQALLNETRATVETMRAIRQIQPQARLIQTEDLAKTHSVPKLAYQARFENERRWLSFDLLLGKVRKSHPMWKFLRSFGLIAEHELEWFLQNPCAPDVLGLNHYVTSERFLDTDLDKYPPHTHGGNGRHRYADVEAVRANRAFGPLFLLLECWERYRIPMAITEAHLGCTREEQLRWLVELWDAGQKAREQGADLRAVTSWALLGSYDWNSLVTRPCGYYEPGAYDARSNPPRPTATARVLKELAEGKQPGHPTLASTGWWKAERRLAGRPLLITGGKGTLARAFARVCEIRGLHTVVTSRADLDIADGASVQQALDGLQPWAVVNCAGYVRVDEAEREAERCLRENYLGPAVLAQECERRGIQLLTFSSDLVFDGAMTRPYNESDPVRPLGVYGQSKERGEKAVLGAHPGALVVRTSAFFGPWDEYNFLVDVLRNLSKGRVYRACADAVVSPTNVCDLANVALDLLEDGASGLWHLANVGSVSWHQLACNVADLAGLDSRRVEVAQPKQLGWVAQRPAFSVLGSERGTLLPTLDQALERFMRECEVGWKEAAGGRI